MTALKNIKFAVLAACAFTGLFFTSCSDDITEAKAEITSFSFRESDNSSLSEDINAVIDNDKGVITVTLPADVYEDSALRSNLCAAISVASGASLTNDSFNWSSNPVTVTVCASGKSRTYIVNIVKKADEVFNGELLFTEYYCGSTYAYKGALNQYIEITNASDHSIDLSAVELNRYVYKEGSRVSASDQSVTLSGTLASGSSYVIYSQRCSMFSSKDSSVFVSDKNYNSIIELNGQTSFTLTSYGNVIDAIGPSDGKGEGWNWGLAKKMVRKSHVSEYDGWNDNEWYAVKATDSSSDVTTAGSWGKDSSTACDLTYFALERNADIIYGTTSSVNIPKSYDLSQKISVSTNGKCVVVAETGEEVVNGHTVIDFSKVTEEDPLVLWVYSWSGDCKVYNITYTDITYQKMYDLPETGDEVVIYYETDKLAMSSTDSSFKSTYRGEVSVTPSADESFGFVDGMASMTVTKVSENTYKLVCDGNYLSTTSTGSTLTFSSSDSSYALWTITKSGTDGLFYIVSTNAAYNGNKQQMEYYKAFRLGTYNASYDYEYSLALYKKQ